jgi:hypothetical protein
LISAENDGTKIPEGTGQSVSGLVSRRETAPRHCAQSRRRKHLSQRGSHASSALSGRLLHRWSELNDLPVPFSRNPFRTLSEFLRYIEFDYFSHDPSAFPFTIPARLITEPRLAFDPYGPATPSHTDNAQNRSISSFSIGPYKWRMISSTSLFSLATLERKLLSLA